MAEEPIFRIISVVIFVTIVCVGLYHRVKAARHQEDLLSHREEGLLIMVLVRTFGFSAWIGFLLYMINPQLMAWSTLLLPYWLRWTGVGFGIVVLPLISWMFISLGKNVTDTVATRKKHSLVISGPYRWIRHPMYSFTFLALIGFSLLSANWFIGVTGLLAFILLVVRTPLEEKKLIEKFGDEYREYMKDTNRFLPRLFKV